MKMRADFLVSRYRRGMHDGSAANSFANTSTPSSFNCDLFGAGERPYAVPRRAELCQLSITELRRPVPLVCVLRPRRETHQGDT